MNGKIVVSVFIVVIIAIFAYYIFVLQSTVINPIDPNDEYDDYQTLESDDTITYRVVGQIVGVNEEELTLRISQRILDTTSERILKIKKPAETRYFRFNEANIVDESEIQENQLVRATITQSKSTNEIVALDVNIFRTDFTLPEASEK